MRRIYTHITLDIENGAIVRADWHWYDGPIDECKSKSRSPLIGKAETISGQERGAGQANINTGTGLERQAVTDPTSSPLYKALYNTEAGQMSRAFDAASSRQAAKARTAGFGYSQPGAQGAESELRGREASSIGQLPGQVAGESVPLELQAGKDITGAGTSELYAGNQMFTSGAVPLEEQFQGYALKRPGLFDRIRGIGSDAASGLIAAGALGA